LNKNEIFCVKIISFNPLVSKLNKYITKLLVFNLIYLTCFNLTLWFSLQIFIWNWFDERKNLNQFPDVSNQSNFPSINSNSWNKVHITHDPFTTLIYFGTLSTWSHTSFDNTKIVQLMNLVGQFSMWWNENLTQFSSSGNPSPNA